VDILETASELDQRPRATHYSSPAVIELRKAGVFEDVEKAGFHPGLVTWRKPDGTEIARMPMSTLEIDYPYPMVCLPVSALGGILMSHVSKLPNIKVLWGHRVVKTGQGDHDAWVDVVHNGIKNHSIRQLQMKNGSLFEKIGITSKMKALWIVGTDGANSTIRKDLGLTFEGSTWDKQLVATNIYYPFDEKNGWTDSNFIISPNNWFMAAKITKDGLWRVTYGEVMGCSDEELVDRQASKFEKMVSGNTQIIMASYAGLNSLEVHFLIIDRSSARLSPAITSWSPYRHTRFTSAAQIDFVKDDSSLQEMPLISVTPLAVLASPAVLLMLVTSVMH